MKKVNFKKQDNLYVKSPLHKFIKYDDIYVQGVKWVESLAGDKFCENIYEIKDISFEKDLEKNVKKL